MRPIRVLPGMGVRLLAVALTALACSPSDDSGSPDLPRLRNLAKAHFENGETDRALLYVDSCLVLGSGQDLDRLNRGKVLFLAERHDEAVAELEALRADRPGWADVPYNLGIIHKRLGRVDDGIRELERFVELEPRSVPGWFNLGVLLGRAGRPDEARHALETVVELDPLHAAAHYQLASLARAEGDPDRAKVEFELFQTLSERIPAERLTPEALEESPAFEMGIRPPGSGTTAGASERAAGDPDDAGSGASGAAADGPASSGAPWPGFLPSPTDGVAGATARDWVAGGDHRRIDVAFADLDGDGGRDLVTLDATPDGVRLRVILHGDVTEEDRAPRELATIPGSLAPTRMLAADLDDDGDPDLLSFGGGAVHLARTQSGGDTPVSVTDETAGAGLDALAHAEDVRVVDYDHDGDLDLHVLLPDARGVLLRNAGAPDAETPLRFAPSADDARLPVEGVRAVAHAHLDLDYDTDLVRLDGEGRVVVYDNVGQQRFAAIGSPIEVEGVGDPVAIAADDLTGDGWVDVVVAGTGGVAVLANRGDHAFELVDGATAPGGDRGTPTPRLDGRGQVSIDLLDADADGALDVLAGGVLYLNRGDGVLDATIDLIPGDGPVASSRLVDLDGDHDLDLALVRSDGRLSFLQNGGGGAPRVVEVRLVGGKSNHAGVGALVDVQAGEHYVRRVVQSGAPIVIGMGPHTRADYVRVMWPSGIVQNEIDVDLTANAMVTVTEKPEPLGSCPSLYVWDGDRFAFVTDVLATASLGLALDGKTPMPFDDEELIRLPRGLARPDSSGHVRLALTEELDEIVYLDRVELWAVDHPPDVSVYANTILREPPFPDADVVAVRNERPPASAVDQRGIDVTDAIARSDGAYAAAFERHEGGGWHGLTRRHWIDLDLGPDLDPERLVIVIDAWMDWPETQTFLALAQNSELELILPRLSVREPMGTWRTVHPGFGIQALKPKEVVVDLRGKLRDGERLVRLESNLADYWNRIHVAEWVDADAEGVRRTKLGPAAASFHFRGWATRTRPDRSPLELYDYHRVNLGAPWIGSEGRFTRYGDVLPLLTGWDDRFVIVNTGDAVEIDVDASGLPATPDGWVRDLFVHVAGFEKQADYGTLASGRVTPLPFRAMSTYPYPAEEADASRAAREAYVDEWNTRVVVAPRPEVER